MPQSQGLPEKGASPLSTVHAYQEFSAHGEVGSKYRRGSLEKNEPQQASGPGLGAFSVKMMQEATSQATGSEGPVTTGEKCLR